MWMTSLQSIVLLWDNPYFSLCRFRLLSAHTVIAYTFGVVYSLLTTTKKSLPEYCGLAAIVETRDKSSERKYKNLGFSRNILVWEESYINICYMLVSILVWNMSM